MKLEFFVSHVCEDCPSAIDLMAGTGLSYETINITGSIAGLKRFLAYRESLPEFKSIIDQNSVGVPLLLVNGGELLIFDFDEEDEVIAAVRQATLGRPRQAKQVVSWTTIPDGKMRRDLGL